MILSFLDWQLLVGFPAKAGNCKDQIAKQCNHLTPKTHQALATGMIPIQKHWIWISTFDALHEVHVSISACSNIIIQVKGGWCGMELNKINETLISCTTKPNTPSAVHSKLPVSQRKNTPSPGSQTETIFFFWFSDLLLEKVHAPGPGSFEVIQPLYWMAETACWNWI